MARVIIISNLLFSQNPVMNINLSRLMGKWNHQRKCQVLKRWQGGFEEARKRCQGGFYALTNSQFLLCLLSMRLLLWYLLQNTCRSLRSAIKPTWELVKKYRYYLRIKSSILSTIQNIIIRYWGLDVCKKYTDHTLTFVYTYFFK